MASFRFKWKLNVIFTTVHLTSTGRCTIDTHSYIHMWCQAHAHEEASPLSVAELNLAEEMKGATITQTFRDKQKSTLDLLLDKDDETYFVMMKSNLQTKQKKCKKNTHSGG